MADSSLRAGLLERAEELREIGAAISAAEQGVGCAVMIEGPAGIGKTRLLKAALCRPGSITMLAARGDDLERDFPWGVVRQLYARTLLGADRAKLHEGAASLAAPALGLEPGEAHGEALSAALHGLYWLTANLALRNPLVLSVDDLQWADVPSLRYLIYLVRRLAGMPVAVLAAVRVGEADPETGGLLERLRAQDAVTVLSPAPLSENATTRLVRARIGHVADRELCRACHETTGGNPFLLEELVRELASGAGRPDQDLAAQVRRLTPGVVSRSVLLRLVRLPPTALATARAVAVLGASASLPTVTALAEASEGLVEEAVRALAAGEILVADQGRLRYMHAIVREAVYQDLSAFERGRWHARAARALAGQNAPIDDVAAHLLAAIARGTPGRCRRSEMLRRPHPKVPQLTWRRSICNARCSNLLLQSCALRCCSSSASPKVSMTPSGRAAISTRL